MEQTLYWVTTINEFPGAVKELRSRGGVQGSVVTAIQCGGIEGVRENMAFQRREGVYVSR